MLIKDSTPTFHQGVVRFLTDNTDFSEFLQCFGVVNGSRNVISRIMFKKGGLKDYLTACRNPEHQLYIGARAEASHCCTRLSAYLVDRMAEYNRTVRAGRNPIPFGSKIWVESSLGLYFTLGNQDLELFFKKGEEIKREEMARLLDDGDHQFDGGN